MATRGFMVCFCFEVFWGVWAAMAPGACARGLLEPWESRPEPQGRAAGCGTG